MADSVQQQVQDKGREIQEHLADVGARLRQNVKEGLRSSVEGDGWTFGRPPAKGPPSARPPLRRSAGHRRSEDRHVATRRRRSARRDDD